MIFGDRLRAMSRIGHATLLVAGRVFSRRVVADDESRTQRLGDIPGQTARAQAFAAKLENSVHSGMEK